MYFMERDTPRPRLQRAFVVAAFVLVFCCFLVSPLVDVVRQANGVFDNPAFREARALLLDGTINLAERAWDSAEYEGRFVNVFQPGQTVLFFLQLLIREDIAPRYWSLEIFLVYMAAGAMWACALVALTRGSLKVALPLAISVILGAPALASLPVAMGGSVYRSNHVLASPFIIAALWLMARPRGWRLWAIGASIGAAMLFRSQNLLLMAIPMLLLFQSESGDRWRVKERLATAENRRAAFRDLVALCAGPSIAVAALCLVNYVRFENPFENGYAYIYEGRVDFLAVRAREMGVWSLAFLKENVWRTLFTLPAVHFEGARIVRIEGDPLGNSLLFSQPILLLAAFAGTALFKPRTLAFLFGAALMALPVLTYHNPGLYAVGYMRYSLDYLFVLVAAIAVALGREAPQVRGWTVAAWLSAAWAVYYCVALLTVVPF
jgi:hypothetical protein